MLQPIIFFHEADAESRLLTIVAIGNPILWWSSTLGVVLSLGELVRRKVIARKPVADHPLVPVLLGSHDDGTAHEPGELAAARVARILVGRVDPSPETPCLEANILTAVPYSRFCTRSFPSGDIHPPWRHRRRPIG
jgi:hypothetical protein